MMRFGVRSFLAQEKDLIICGEADCAKDALVAIHRLSPDVVLLDITLRGRSGLDLLKDLRLLRPRLPVLVYSLHDETIFAERALRAGARGYLMKQEAGHEIVSAIRQVLRGEIYLGRALKERTNAIAGKRPSRTAWTPVASLSNREFEIFSLIGRGNTNREIAGHLHLSVKTVEAHREHIKRKLGLASSTALNLLAVRWEHHEFSA